MNKILFLTLLLLGVINCTPQQESSLRVATFNIRYDNPADSLNNWQYRKEHVYKFIKDQELSVVSFQEVLYTQLQDLERNLPEYQFVGVGRDDGKTEGEYACVAFLKNSFERLDSNTFWLSENPDSIGQKGWDAACTRIATWAKLKDKSNGKVFMVVNTHFDHVGSEARKNSALLIINKIKEIVGDNPAVLTGDFNITDQSDAYKTITTNEFVLLDAHKKAAAVTGVDYTFQNFGKISDDSDHAKKIDFIFITPQIKSLKSDIPSAQIDSVLYLSDHNPHIVAITF
ncbi:MAG: hypothetical protein RL662_217 [Bacteroidota bacterium]|jgi:endonuclease/exonuclease/phosphatase family metal-dependent hydrolase